MTSTTDIPPTSRILVLLGPTAGGKSDLAIALATRFAGQVINADSMQVYRRLDAGTAKPSPAQRQAVPHHLVDVVDLDQPWTVADWLAGAEAAISAIHAAKGLPIVVGGTNFYLKALLEGMFDGPGADEAFRAQMADQPPQKLHLELAAIDPAAAQRINPNDHKRIVRALEVHRQTGQPISHFQRQWTLEKEKQYRHNPILIGLQYSPEAINRRINARVKGMFDPPEGVEGLLEETRRLKEAGLIGIQASQALGTRQVLEHLAGRWTLQEAIEQVKIETRRFAKSQRTWLKRFRGVHWLEADQRSSQELIEAAIEIVGRELVL